MNAWIRLSRRVEQLISTWSSNSNQLRIISILMLLPFLSLFHRFELEHHIISMPPTLSQQRVFLLCFPCLEAIKIPANSETFSRLNSIYAHKYDPDSPHPGLGVHSLSHPKVIWKMLSNHPCLPIIHSHARLKGDAVGKTLDWSLEHLCESNLISTHFYFSAFLVVLFVGLDYSSDFATVGIVTCLVNMSHANRRWFETQGSEATKL